MAPVTGRVSDREQDRFVLGLRTLERVRTPRIPIDGIVSVLPQVRALLVDQTIRFAPVMVRGFNLVAHLDVSGFSSLLLSKLSRSTDRREFRKFSFLVCVW